jgi:hypothetical protein
MWYVYDEYAEGDLAREYEFSSIQEAGDWIEASDDPLTYRIGYRD